MDRVGANPGRVQEQDDVVDGGGCWGCLEGVGDVATKALDWIKAPGMKNLVAKPLDLTRQWAHWYWPQSPQLPQNQLSPAFNQITGFGSAAKSIVGASEALTKIPTVLRPLPELSIHARVANEIAPNAGLLEKVGKLAARVSDWVMSVCDLHEFFKKTGVTSFSKEFSRGVTWVMNSAGSVLSCHGIYEEVTRLSTGVVVITNPRRNDEGEIVGQNIYEMQAADYVLSALKLAMSVSYLVVSTLGILSLCNVVVPFAMFLQLTALTLACATAISQHFVRQLAVRSELRAAF